MLDKFQNSQQQHYVQAQQQPKLKKQSKSYHNSIMSESSSVMIATSPSPSQSPNHLYTNNPINSPKSTANNTNMPGSSDQNSEQNYTNSRFFDSSTLYKKELKQKQRDIISSSTSSLSFANAISTTTTNESSYNMHTAKFQQPTTLEEEAEQEEECPAHQQQPQAISTSNKMLNLFSNFLSRHNNHSKSSLNTQSNDSSHSNYLNIKNLKRATSSTNFGGSIKTKVSSPPTFTSESSSTSINKLLFNPAALFSMNNLGSKHKNSDSSSKQYQQQQQQQQANLPPSLSFIKSNNKYRRSYDDVSKLSILISDSVPSEQQQQPQQNKKQIISPKSTAFSFGSKKSSKSQLTTNQETSLDSTSENTENIFIDLSNNSKFENTAFSTKNNGLIFLPSPTKCRTPSPPEQQQQQQQQQQPTQKSPQAQQNYGDNYEVIENVNNSRNISKINYDSLLENECDLIG